MIETNRVLQPLREAEGAIAKLQDYKSTAELASAVRATHAAVQKSLRYLLRADRNAPDEIRLAALSPAELSSERLLPALRQRDLLSLDLAGRIHELEQAARRAENGDVRAADGDLGMRVVDQLSTEVQAHGEKSVRDVAHSTVQAGALDDAHEVPDEKGSRRPVRAIAFVALAAVAALALVLLLHKTPTDRGVAQFRAHEYSQAERTLRPVVDDDPGNAIASYYLAILYRRSERYDEAGKVLRRSIEKNPADAYLREELGNLFMTLKQPALAAKQFRVAQEQDAGNARYWIKLITAMRAAGDPEADAMLQRAPDEARAMLQSVR